MEKKKIQRSIFSARCSKEDSAAWRRFLDTLPGDDCEHLEAAMRLYRAVPKNIRKLALQDAPELKRILGKAGRNPAGKDEAAK